MFDRNCKHKQTSWTWQTVAFLLSILCSWNGVVIMLWRRWRRRLNRQRIISAWMKQQQNNTIITIISIIVCQSDPIQGKQSSFWIRNWSFITTTTSSCWGDSPQKKVKAPSFQIGSGQNVTGMFFKEICTNWQSDFLCNVILSRWQPWRHFTQKSDTTWWVHAASVCHNFIKYWLILISSCGKVFSWL